MTALPIVRIIGAGLAGAEAALYLAGKGIKVRLSEMKPLRRSPAHHSDDCAELVCSNSLKSADVYGNACGLLKEEMKRLGSRLIPIAESVRVAAGNALAVDRKLFSAAVTRELDAHPLVDRVAEEVTEVDFDSPVIFATGPLTSDALCDFYRKVAGECSFYDAAAPIVDGDTIDRNYAFVADRYGEVGKGDYLNCPLNKEEYTAFYNALITAERAPLKEFEKVSVFEGCMPVEVMASRGEKTLRYGPMKPTGLDDPRTGRWPYACVQLRKEDAFGTRYNMVGFQTNLLFGEQKRVFGMIPALKNAEYYRYGVMHRNFYLNSPTVLQEDFSLSGHPLAFFAGQLTGVEGYVESMASGLACAIHLYRKLTKKSPVRFGEETVIGALSLHVCTETERFDPMNANYGILSPLPEKIRDKTAKKRALSERALQKVDTIKEILDD